MQRARHVLAASTIVSCGFVWYAHDQQIREKEVRCPLLLAAAAGTRSAPHLRAPLTPRPPPPLTLQRMHAGVLRDIAREEEKMAAQAAAAAAGAAAPQLDADPSCPSGVCALATKRVRPAAAS